MDKQKEIEEMAKILRLHLCDNANCETCNYGGEIKGVCVERFLAKRLYEQGYRNCKDKVVLSREEYEDLTDSEIGELVKENKELEKQCVAWSELVHRREERDKDRVIFTKENYDKFLKEIKIKLEEMGKETAEKFYKDIHDIITKSDGFLCEEVLRITAKQIGAEIKE